MGGHVISLTYKLTQCFRYTFLMTSRYPFSDSMTMHESSPRSRRRRRDSQYHPLLGSYHSTLDEPDGHGHDNDNDHDRDNEMGMELDEHFPGAAGSGGSSNQESPSLGDSSSSYGTGLPFPGPGLEIQLEEEEEEEEERLVARSSSTSLANK